VELVACARPDIIPRYIMQRRLDNSNYRLRRKCSGVPEAHNQTHPLARMLTYKYTYAQTQTRARTTHACIIHVRTHYITICPHPIRSMMTYVEPSMQLMRVTREFPTDRVSWLPPGNSRHDLKLPENIGECCTSEKKSVVWYRKVLLELTSETLLEIIEGSLTLENRLRKEEKENSPRLS